MVLLLTACSLLAPQGERYYSGNGPDVSGVSGDASEPGNLGGFEATITGSGFGDNADDLVVMFGSQNAEILSASDGEIVVITPVGPVTGGAVDIRVASPDGQGKAEGAYSYEINDIYDGQVGFISIDDYSQSQSSFYVGVSGTEGTGHLYAFEFRRVHTPEYGWFGGTDWTDNEWVMETPSYPGFLGATDRLRQPWPADLSVVDVDEDGNAIGEAVCLNLNALGTWYDAASGTMVFPDDTTDANMSACDDGRSGYRVQDSSRLDFCERIEFETDTNEYIASYGYEQPWAAPVGERSDPFDRQDRIDSCHDGQDNDNDGLTDEVDSDCVVNVVLDAPQTGVDEVTLQLPLAMQVEITSGVNGTELSAGGFTQVDDCPAGDTALELRWWPSEVDFDSVIASDDKIVDAATHIRVSLTMISLGWFGGEANPMRATLVVDDEYSLVDEESGEAVLTVPRDVLLAFPTVEYSPFVFGGCETDAFTGQTTCPWGDPASNNYGYLIFTVDRVTEYRLRSEHPSVNGDLVVAYTSGDLGFFYNNIRAGYAAFESPLEKPSCEDCTDNDGDGWVDADDADCVDGEEEDGTYDADYSCSDGIDNDGNGFIDFEDTENCETGTDGETNCFNGKDDDWDGWIDALDGECATGGADAQESDDDDPAWTCTNDLDDDGDGWFDAEDPDCTDGSMTEDGFTTAQCNDGLDNDGHGDIDSEDPLCIRQGGSFAWEAPAPSQELAEDGQPYFKGDCVDELDNETGAVEGYTDAFDPDCEKPPNYWQETDKRASSDEPEFSQCYDGEDNDGDGLEDADDPGCWNVNPAFGFVAVPDGFLDDEADDGDCMDGEDNDLDTLTDLDDPGCAPGVGKAEATADP